jgi:hypothetical protein
MDQRALWLSSSLAAAKLATALWCGQLALAQLDRRRAILGWQILLAALSTVVAGWAWTAQDVPKWWKTVWLIAAILSATLLFEALRRWLSISTAPPRSFDATNDMATVGSDAANGRRGAGDKAAQRDMIAEPLQGSLWVHWTLSWICLVLGLAATTQAVWSRLPAESVVRYAACLQIATAAGLFGSLLASTLELTGGATGATLLQLRWKQLMYWTSLCFAAQMVIGVGIIAAVRAVDSPEESIAPVLFALGMSVLGYIIWCIPNRMVALARKGQVEGQVSLAMAGWLAVICLTIASLLPPAWPWNQLARRSTSATALAIIKQ